MASKETFAEILDRKTNDKSSVPLQNDKGTLLPVKAGRQSIPEDVGTLGGLFNHFALINPEFPIELLKAIEHLATFHPEVSEAVENIVTLGNTDFSVTFDESVSSREAKLMNARIKEKSKDLYTHSGGTRSLVNDLLAQAAINGAISAEAVPSDSLDGIKKAVLVAPKNIRFRYDQKEDCYIANQLASGNTILSTNTNALNHVELNPNTYLYVAMRRFSEKPYAIPPFLAALWNITIDKDMIGNIAIIIKKLGVLGFMQTLITSPKRKPNEGDAAYWNRSLAHLNTVAPEIEKGLAKGYVVGYKDKHEFKHQNTTGNVMGAKDLVGINDSKLMSGLKQPPMMFGRTFSTTESFARVLLAKMGTQIKNYQQVVACFLERLFLLDLQLAGFNIRTVNVVFEAPMTGDRVREEEVRGAKFDNLKKEYDQGLIDQPTFATEMGRDKPAEEEPRAPTAPAIPTQDPNDEADETEGDGKTDPDEGEDTDEEDEKTTGENKKLLSSLTGVKLVTIEYHHGRVARAICLNGVLADPKYYKLGKIISIDGLTLEEGTENQLEKYYPYLEEFAYESCSCCSSTIESLIKGDDDLTKFVRQYFFATRKQYRKAVDKMTGKVSKALLGLGQGASEQQITDLILLTLYKDWDTVFTKPQTKTINKFVNLIYRFFRNDKSVFNTSEEDKVPNAAFSAIDARALSYYKKSDVVYLGKFITDKDLKVDITQFVKDEFLSRNIPTGDQQAIVAAFRRKFGTVLQGKEWKIAQIINTTTNKMRNSAAVAYFDQAEVETFEIRGVNDSIQCEYCANLQGKQFTVSRTVTALTNTYNSDPEFVKVDTPFITSVFKSPKDMEDLTGSELQDLNFNLVPAHPHCRDVVVPIL